MKKLVLLKHSLDFHCFFHRKSKPLSSKTITFVKSPHIFLFFLLRDTFSPQLVESLGLQYGSYSGTLWDNLLVQRYCIWVTMNSSLRQPINKLTDYEICFQGINQDATKEPQGIVSENVDLLAALFPRKKCADSVFIGSLVHSTKHGSHNRFESEHFFLKKSAKARFMVVCEI